MTTVTGMQRTVTVAGHGTTKAVPDSAMVRVAATHQAPTVAEAVAGVDSAMSVVSRVAREYTDAARIQSSGMQVWSSHDREGRPNGFEASHQVSVGVPNLPAASALVVALAEEVGDRLRIEAVRLEISNPAGALAQAREAAFADARARAEHLAGLAGASLGEVLTLVEGGQVAGPAPLRAMAAMADGGFEAGESAISGAVTVTWQLV